MNSDDAFLRAALYEECTKSAILQHVDIENASVEGLRDLLNKNNLVVFRKMPILMSKVLVKYGLEYLKTKFKPLSMLTPESIRVCVEADEMQYLLTTSSKFQPNIIFIVSKNIVLSLIGTSISTFKDELIGATTSTTTSSEKRSRRSFSKIVVAPPDEEKLSWSEISRPREFTNQFSDISDSGVVTGGSGSDEINPSQNDDYNNAEYADVDMAEKEIYVAGNIDNNDGVGVSGDDNINNRQSNTGSTTESNRSNTTRRQSIAKSIASSKGSIRSVGRRSSSSSLSKLSASSSNISKATKNSQYRTNNYLRHTNNQLLNNTPPSTITKEQIINDFLAASNINNDSPQKAQINQNKINIIENILLAPSSPSSINNINNKNDQNIRLTESTNNKLENKSSQVENKAIRKLENNKNLYDDDLDNNHNNNEVDDDYDDLDNNSEIYIESDTDDNIMDVDDNDSDIIKFDDLERSVLKKSARDFETLINDDDKII